MKRTLYLFGSAAPPVFDVARVIEEAQADGWDVCLGLTPTAARWLEDGLAGLAALTGHPVRSRYGLPGEPDIWPEPDVILVAPVTFDTLNQWALGLTGKFVVGVVAEGIGRSIPMVAMPCAGGALTAHPQFARSVDTLRSAGVSVLCEESGVTPRQWDSGAPDRFPWRIALDEAARLSEARPTL
ncbi:flavoprotein [Streptomyces sp. SP18CS02]|uniref:flavoprotein n=1 Tax=Streptomyces sp. SP18CS02 TaxID=3002531 RepID=UPI002E773203|nr:flavoprotein [Streptomyces sp. SP18CS02]MEE1753817.1 flavoprotein [Streptomyces sp. SP18CS02]